MRKELTAIRQLELLADAYKAALHPNLPAHAGIKSKYDDRTANGLTRCVVDFLKFSGHFATRLSSTGLYREDLKKFVPSAQRVGLPDVLACVDGRYYAVEVKVGRDRLSDEQKKAIEDLRRAGAYVFVANTFQGFLEWFTALNNPPFA